MLLSEVRDILGITLPGVLNALGPFVDFSDMGGDGGVWVSERPDDDAVFPGGVSKDGAESEFVGESSDLGEVDGGAGSK